LRERTTKKNRKKERNIGEKKAEGNRGEHREKKEGKDKNRNKNKETRDKGNRGKSAKNERREKEQRSKNKEKHKRKRKRKQGKNNRGNHHFSTANDNNHAPSLQVIFSPSLFPLTCLFRLHAECEQFTFCSK
jgi:hypothetical protein